MATTAELQARLTAAENAYHDLMIGHSVAELRDQNGEMVRYTPASVARLSAYIEQLKVELKLKNPSAPAKAYF